TDATPEKIQKIFPESVYENQFGTVGVKTESEDPRLKIIEVTTFREEGKYTDKRHPDEVRFAKTIEEDLSRRDFTVNSMALRYDTDLSSLGKEVLNSHLVDPFQGRDDLDNRTIRTVRKAEERFDEDALRLMRAVRFASEMDFQIDGETRLAMEKKAGLLEMIAKERIRDEFIKIIMSSRAGAGILLLEELDLLRYVMPELREGLGMSQNLHHIYTVFEHNLRALDYAVKQNYSLEVRLASLLHDVGKPKTKHGEGKNATFYNHEVVGAKMTLKILDRLHFGKEVVEHIAHLIRYHMFYYNVGEVTAAGVRRFLARVGPENVDDLMKVREADRIGSGVPKAVPYKLRHFLFMIEKVKHDPISPKMLKVTGSDIMHLLSISPGPRVGYILSILLEDVLDNPQNNLVEYLEKRVRELGKLNEDELRVVAAQAKNKKDEFESGVEEEMKKKYFVK
ncbi:MAG: HD domain-containing protein, partial [Patescibacteria group bacterium]